MNTPSDSISGIHPQLRGLLDKYLPWIIVAVVLWLASKSFTKLFWSGFGMYWALRGSGIRLF